MVLRLERCWWNSNTQRHRGVWPMWGTGNINKQVRLGRCEEGAATGPHDNRDWGTRSCWGLFLTLDLR